MLAPSTSDLPDDAWATALREFESLGTDLSRLAPSTHGDSTSIWTPAKIAARTWALEKRRKTIERLLLLHREESDVLDLLDKRAKNSFIPINRLPTELFIIILRLAIVHHPWTIPGPRELAAVCHAWRGIVNGPAGACLFAQMGACIYPHDGVKQHARVTRSLSVALSQSRSLPFQLWLSAEDDATNPPPPTVNTMTYLIASELERCETLCIRNTPYFRTIFPLSGRMDRLVNLMLDFADDSPSLDADHRPPLFSEATIPALRQLTLYRLDHVDRPETHRLFENPSLTLTCTELSLVLVYGSRRSVLELIGRFHNLQFLELEYVNSGPSHHWEGGDGASTLDFPITLPRLEGIKCGDGDSAHLLDFIVAPSLQQIEISNRNGGMSYQIPSLFTSHPSLSSVRLIEMDNEMFALDRLLAGGCELGSSSRTIFCEDWPGSHAVLLGQLVGYVLAHSSVVPATRSRVKRQGGRPDVELLLWISPHAEREYEGEHAEKLADGRRRLLGQLQALAMLQQRREQVFGAGFRVRVSDVLVSRYSKFQATIARYPGFLGVVQKEEFMAGIQVGYEDRGFYRY